MTKTGEQLQWEEFVRTGKGREALIKRYLPLIKYVVGRMAVTPPQGLDYEDILSFGVFEVLCFRLLRYLEYAARYLMNYVNVIGTQGQAARKSRN